MLVVLNNVENFSWDLMKYFPLSGEGFPETFYYTFLSHRHTKGRFSEMKIPREMFSIPLQKTLMDEMKSPIKSVSALKKFMIQHERYESFLHHSSKPSCVQSRAGALSCGCSDPPKAHPSTLNALLPAGRPEIKIFLFFRCAHKKLFCCCARHAKKKLNS